MEVWVTLVFVLVYLGMALGRVPGLRIGRSGMAIERCRGATGEWSSTAGFGCGDGLALRSRYCLP
jgi:hypothetical protein